MDMKLTLPLTCLFLLLVSGCAKEQATYTGEVIPFIENVGLVNDTAFLDSASIFLPETKQDALISGVDRVIENDSIFLLLDVGMKQVLGYAKSGKHMFTIHAVGNGPGEYVNLFDMALDRQEERLLLTYPPAIHYYALDGEYERTEPLDEIYKSLAVTDQCIYLRKDTYVNKQLSDYSLLTIEKEGGKQHQSWKPLPEAAPFCTTGHTQTSGSEPVYLTRKFDNTIYAMNGHRMKKVYDIDWGSQTFPANDSKQTYTCNELNKLCREKKYVYTMTDLCDTPRHLLFQTNQPGLCILFKEKKEVKNYRIIMNTEYQLAMPNYIPVEGNKGRIFFIFPSDMLKMSIQANGNPPNAKQSRLWELLSEEDNPVIFSYCVKG